MSDSKVTEDSAPKTLRMTYEEISKLPVELEYDWTNRIWLLARSRYKEFVDVLQIVSVATTTAKRDGFELQLLHPDGCTTLEYSTEAEARAVLCVVASRMMGADRGVCHLWDMPTPKQILIAYKDGGVPTKIKNPTTPA